MTRPAQGLPGGAQAAITTTPVAVDLSALRGRTVAIGCDDDDIWFAFGDGTSTTLVTAGDSAASLSSLKAKRLAKGYRAPFMIGAYPYLIVRGVTTTGTVHVDVRSELDGADVDTTVSSSPSLGTVSISDGSGPLTVDGTVVVTDGSGSLTVDGGVTVTQGAPTKTTNATYQTATSMAADIDCAAITVGPEGRLVISAKWTASSAQIGVLVLQALSVIDGTTYVDVPGSSGAFTSHPISDTAEVFGYFRELQPFTTVRLKYRRTSGGAAGNNFTAATRVM